MGWIANLRAGGNVGANTETISADGAANPTIPVTLCDASSVDLDITLPDPPAGHEGIIKTFVGIDIDSDGGRDVTITPDNTLDTSATDVVELDLTGGVGQFIWTGSKWASLGSDADVSVS